MNNNIETTITPNNSKVAAGVILLTIGSVLLIREFDILLLPDWLFSWPMWMIAWGTYMGAKYNFRKPGWIIVSLLGLVFLLNENIAGADRFVWPVAIMGLGTWLILRPKKQPEAFYFEKPKEPFHFDQTTQPEA